MKIAVIHLYLATASGDPRMALSVAKAFKSAGHEVKVYASEFNPAFLPHLHEGLDIVEVRPRASLSSVLGASGIFAKVFERLRRDRLYDDSVRRISSKLDPDFDFIFCENDYSYKLGVHYKKINPRTKIVWLMNNPPFYHSRKNNFLENILSAGVALREKAVAKKFASGIDWAIVYDKENKKGAESIGLRAKLIANPLDFAYFYSPIRKPKKNGPLRLLSVGALSPLRRFEDTVSAVSILRKMGHDARALIVCKDYWGDKDYRNKFVSFIEASGAGDYIDAKFDGISEAEMLRALAESHFSVVPNNAKVWVATACEAMASGLPLVISKATSMIEALTDGKNAFFVEPLSPDQIARKIDAAIKNPKLYSEVALGGQKYVKENLSFDNFIKKICEE